MRVEPKALSRDLISTALTRRWGIVTDGIDYLPVGGGGHHWLVTADDSRHWFVTANGLVDRGHWLERDADSIFARTEIAYEAVRDLALPSAVPPIPDRTGALLYRIHPDWALSVYPYLDAVGGADAMVSRELAGIVGQLHKLPPPARVPRWRSDLPQRSHLEHALVERDRPRPTGPYGEAAHALLNAHRTRLTELLREYDRLTSIVEAGPEPWVLTHGEPNDGNALKTSAGTVLLIDWDTLAVAPRERDLWQLMDSSDDETWDAYREASGCAHEPRPALMEFFLLWWRLSDIGSRVQRFRSPHVGDGDDDAAWQNLESAFE